ncbi:hypothetical protein AB0A71_20665 [Kitasatospora aureofaciens]|uniref:hypothetical protein n=1 Tax=Kitasatospora aureofaciens TaxID=1894 RepID=UPI003401BBE1
MGRRRRTRRITGVALAAATMIGGGVYMTTGSNPASAAITSSPASGIGSNRASAAIKPSSVKSAARPGSPVEFTLPASNQIVKVQTSFTVPSEQPHVGTTFLWPGLQPLGGANFNPIGEGVLQPVLTWGSSCAPAAGEPVSYSSWWISGQYVNTEGSQPGYHGCFSGKAMKVNPGDELNISMRLDSASGKWIQTITDGPSHVSFSEDLHGQARNWLLFVIENYDGASFNAPLSFRNTRVDFQNADPGTCNSWGAEAGVSGGATSINNGLRCVINTVTV